MIPADVVEKSNISFIEELEYSRKNKISAQIGIYSIGQIIFLRYVWSLFMIVLDLSHCRNALGNCKRATEPLYPDRVEMS